MAVQDNAVPAVRLWLWLLCASLSLAMACAAYAAAPTTQPGDRTAAEVSSSPQTSASAAFPDLLRWSDQTPDDDEADDSDTLTKRPTPNGPLLDFDRPLFADDDDRVINQIHLGFKGTYIWSPVAGYTQIPKKAKRLSTSHQRPRLSQLGVWNVSIPDLELSANYGPHQLFVGAQIIRASGRGQTAQPLTTENTRFAVNAHLRSTLGFDWYRFGYRYTIPLFEAENGVPTLTITPQFNAIFWDFNYRVVSGKQRVTANIQKFNGMGGVDVEWRPRGGPFSIDVDAMASPPTDVLPMVAWGEAAAKYRFLQTSAFDLTGSLGVGVERIDYHDAHLRSTHIRADFGPMITAGLEFHF